MSSSSCGSVQSKKEKVCETRELQVMWRRSIVQARVRRAVLALTLLACVGACGGADLVIEIPGSGEAGEASGHYRLEYRPAWGSPPPNVTVPARAATINFQGLPGTNYHFMLYYSNDTFTDLLTWNQTITTAPEPPTNLTVTLGRNKQATISWAPPAHGDYTGFRFKVVGGSEGADGRNVTVSAEEGGGGNWSYTLRELAPGALYQLHAFTLLRDKESAAYASTNFTTKPNTPGKFIVWFRNETTLLVLWQPPYPPGAYTHYKVSIVPGDARESELYVEKEGEPPGPAQAAFKGLVPGRAYNISVQTVAEPEISAPTTAQYRTVPLRPSNVTVPPAAVTTGAFTVLWQPPHDHSEFEKYQVSVSGGGSGSSGTSGRRLAPVVKSRDEPTEATFEGLEPGQSYTVTVKTMSGKVTSWPAHTEVTLKPLPVKNLQWRYSTRGEAGEAGEAGGVRVWWSPAEGSTQDEYKVWYQEAGPSRDDSSSVTVRTRNVTLEALLPGRNYSVSVAAVSRGVQGQERGFVAATPPLAPVLRAATADTRALRLAWGSDVNSRQDLYRVRWRRAGSGGGPTQPYAHLDTADTSATLEPLEPGAVYEIQLCALAHTLRSEWLTVHKPVRPLPPAWLAVERATSNSVVVVWRGPGGDAVVGAYLVRYRTRGQAAWTAQPPHPAAADRAEILNMTHGERYEIQLDTLSEPAGPANQTLESGRPLEAEHTVRPNPVSNVAQLADTRNMTLEWPVPGGRVEWYEVTWRALPEDDEDAAEEGGARGGARNVSASGGGGGASAAGADGGGASAGGGRVVALLAGLWPGARYSVSIAAHSYNLTSDLFTMETRTRPAITSEMTIVNESGDYEKDAEPAILVVFTRTPRSASRFDSYMFTLESAGGARQSRTLPAAGAPQQVVFGALEAGQLYNVTMWTLSRNLSSHPVQRQVRLFPRPISQLNATAIGSESISLAWDRPRGVYTDFLLQYLAAADTLLNRTSVHPALTVSGLRPHSLYTFTVEVRAGAPGSLLTVSRSFSASFGTREAPPAAPIDFHPVDAKPSEISFRWELPAPLRHGVLRRFILSYWPAGGAGGAAGNEAGGERGESAARELVLPGEARAGTVRGLSPGAAYEFSLRGETGAGRGAAARWAQTLAIGAPPRPAADATPAPLRRTTTTLAVRFRQDYFSNANGNVTAYTLVVGEEPRNTSGPLPAWRDVRRLPVWPPYQVTEPYFPFAAAPVEEFTIGAERCEDSLRTYCNGPLKPATKYYVKLRAFTAPDKYTDTHYTVLYTEVDNSGWVWAGVSLAALAGAGVAGGAAWRARRARSPPAPRHQAPTRPVRVHDFLHHYRLMAADSDFRFSEEFEELKQVGREQPCTAADLPCNRPKNRFTNILPYDHSRYKLQPVDDEEGSDYINANYVPGHNSPREFIVTQGPLHCTRDDFWRMCWESGTRAIVMLTRCVEKGREKCDRYWPYDTRPVYYGDIAVQALNESRFPDWTISELLVSRGAEQRVLTHFHFTTWPDFGVPSPPTTLVRFVRAFRERHPAAGEAAGDVRPVVVHCSAGVGRSGTFITLDRALQQLARGQDHLDIFGMVHAMRRERVWMVQTEQQYIAVHQCLVAVLEGQDLQPPPPPPDHDHHNPAFDDDEGIAESGM